MAVLGINGNILENRWHDANGLGSFQGVRKGIVYE
jgi:hypothetical protein